MTIRITDHALVRFMERAGGLDVEALRSQLQASLTKAAATAGMIGARSYVVRADGLQYLVRNGTLISVAPDGFPMLAVERSP